MSWELGRGGEEGMLAQLVYRHFAYPRRIHLVGVRVARSFPTLLYIINYSILLYCIAIWCHTSEKLNSYGRSDKKEITVMIGW